MSTVNTALSALAHAAKEAEQQSEQNDEADEIYRLLSDVDCEEEFKAVLEPRCDRTDNAAHGLEVLVWRGLKTKNYTTQVLYRNE